MGWRKAPPLPPDGPARRATSCCTQEQWLARKLLSDEPRVAAMDRRSLKVVTASGLPYFVPSVPYDNLTGIEPAFLLAHGKLPQFLRCHIVSNLREWLLDRDVQGQRRFAITTI